MSTALPPCPTLAIDGPSGSGKSTLARRIAAAEGFLFLDTGAMYRALALGLSRHGWVEPFLEASAAWTGVHVTEGRGASEGRGDFAAQLEEVPELAAHLEKIDVSLDAAGRVLLEGRAVGDEIRGPAIDRLVSPISALPLVRHRMVDLQREARDEIGRTRSFGGIVAEGRDMGSVVFPDATLKIYLDADVRERARRRQAEESARGKARSLDEVERELEERDRRDSQRAASPLVCAPDAVRIDTTGRGLDELEERIRALLRARRAGSR
ncbi:MAG: (d)CMP kinase [Planctomycetes bacterium]|nr:(d)CMP kinase [Planctomycetota bacterium]